ncbi:PREDICTED: pentatricopeptide repeat-containing protein At5g47360 [Tarenaya hassleriana]|uniref:pentatricopeptide repeat-containing protein At5g47360 n=1 Tax=Tarenaya hassleriana TaxID=28532 RepID=UPI00053C90EF|nr:PREDICTED: pentatricopeptide repeat-containing protein At5g47360 [Tarenaya hassleriana]
MLIHSISRVVSPSIRSQPSKVSALGFCSTVSAAERLYQQLQTCPSNVEKALASVSVKLDAACVGEVVGRCKRNQFHSGFRFFVWAGTQSGYRHSLFMYNKACDVFEISRNPGMIKDVIDAYRAEKCSVSVKSLKVILNLCHQARLPDEALWVLRKMPEFNLRADTVSYNLVIRSLVDKGDVNTADQLMKEMGLVNLYPDVITYSSVIKGFCSVGMLEDAWRLTQTMNANGCTISTVIYSTLVEGFCRSGRVEKALDLLGFMEKEGGSISPDTITYTMVIQALCERKRIREAVAILDRMEDRGCFPNRVTASILVKGFLETEDEGELSKLVKRLAKRGGVPMDECFSSAVAWLAGMKRWEETEDLFRQMLECGMRPDGLACSLVLRQICSQARYHDCFCLYEDIEKMKVNSTIDSDILSILLLGLCEQGHSREATELAGLMLEKKIRLNVAYAEKIIEYLKKVGEPELVRFSSQGLEV